MICADCAVDEMKPVPERRKKKVDVVPERRDDRNWIQDKPGYWKEQEQLNLQAILDTEQRAGTWTAGASVVYQGLSLCARHFAKRRLEINQDEYGQSRRETW